MVSFAQLGGGFPYFHPAFVFLSLRITIHKCIHIFRRESARVRGKTPEGLPMEDPEEAFLKLKQREGMGEPAVTSRTKPRLLGDVSMAASNASADGTLRLRQV